MLTGCSKGIIVTLGEDAPDLDYARNAADALRMELKHVIISRQQALDAIPEVIAVLRSFDPAIPNDLAVYFGLKAAQSMGFRSVITGDGSDELFGGYSYMRSIDDLDEYIRGLSRIMTFNSTCSRQALRDRDNAAIPGSRDHRACPRYRAGMEDPRKERGYSWQMGLAGSAQRHTA